MSCGQCGGTLDEQDECPACAAEQARSLAEYQRRGGYHPSLGPVGPWRSREDLIRDGFAD